MKITTLKIKNFRAIKDIEMKFTGVVNVIVGPNAVGKTSILEAIRLAKDILAPRTGSESVQILTSLGAMSPHTPNRINFEAIARDGALPVVIESEYDITESELCKLAEEQSIESLAMSFLQSRIGLQPGSQGPNSMVQYLSSPAGKEEYKKDKERAGRVIQSACKTKKCKLGLTIPVPPAQIQGSDGDSQALFSLLELQLPPTRTRFSYFPADRALPSGEANMQIGTADANQQLESHNSQPHLKYARLKNTIFANTFDEKGRDLIKKEFESLFKEILRGRSLEGYTINELGMFTVRIKDTATHRTFDIDGLSSGEKGLILMFLLIARSVERGGMILIDEPELHLNPSVCKAVLGFLLDSHCKPNDIQAIICSHSPEILASALDETDCALYHLISESSITPVREKDHVDAAEALARLGLSEVDELLYRGIVFVEGKDDLEVLEAGCGDILRRYKLTELGGRNDLEKHIKALQTAASDHKLDGSKYFILDLDGKPLKNITSSPKVKVMQWKRTCLENYLLDEEAIYDAIKNNIDSQKAEALNLGDFKRWIKRAALAQIDELVAREIYENYSFEDPGIRAKEIRDKDVSEITKILADRLAAAQKKLAAWDLAQWKENFTNQVTRQRDEKLGAWEENDRWKIECNGKWIYERIQKEFRVNANPRKLKTEVVKSMRESESREYKELHDLITRLLNETATLPVKSSVISPGETGNGKSTGIGPKLDGQ